MGNMSIRGYARSRDAAPKSVRRAIQKRIIILDENGKVDPEQADATWGRLRRARAIDTEKRHEESRRNTTARIAAAAAKLRLAKQQLDSEQNRYVDRVEALKVGSFEADYFIAALAAAPDVYAEPFIAALGVAPAIGRQILGRYIELISAEIGDLRDEAIRTVESL